MTTPARTAALEQIDRLLARARFLVQCLKATGTQPEPAAIVAAVAIDTAKPVQS